MDSFLAIPPDSHFPLQNLPYGIFSSPGRIARVGVRLGDWVVDLAALNKAGLLPDYGFARPELNHFMALGRPAWQETRAILQHLLAADNPTLRDQPDLRQAVLFPAGQVAMHLPATIGDYTDFYSSREHATNVGIMFRGRENALMPNWLHLPVAYHGRASSIVLSGQAVHRPMGQTKADEAELPTFHPSRTLDFELEMGFLIGPGNELGRPIPIQEAEKHIFGLVLVNDWSARDIQRWEYQPLGPFLAKNFATSISPWVVTLEALEPFRCPSPLQEPEPLPYLQSAAGTYDIKLEVALQSPTMPEPMVISRSNFHYLYWNMAQQLAHHTVGGCNLRPGDLLASGTISGPTPDSYGSMLELTWRGNKPILLPNGESRKFLQDGDQVIISGRCQATDYQIGFGALTGRILPPVS